MFKKRYEPEPLCGGTTDRTDRQAPKVINTKNIMSLSTHFSLVGEWQSGRDIVECELVIKPNESGIMTVTEPTLSISYEADKELLDKVQDIIDREGLARKNGIYKVTAGLPPEFQPCYLIVDYASGERLSFTENNEPEAAWAKQMYLLAADWFAQKGSPAMLPPNEKEQVEKLSVELNEKGLKTRYSAILVDDENAINGERELFCKRVWSYDEEKTVCKVFALFPEDFYIKVSAVINSFDLRPFDRCSALYGMGRNMTKRKDEDSADLKIHITYVNGHRLNIDTSDPNDIEMLRPMINELFGYYDSLF